MFFGGLIIGLLGSFWWLSCDVWWGKKRPSLFLVVLLSTTYEKWPLTASSVRGCDMISTTAPETDTFLLWGDCDTFDSFFDWWVLLYSVFLHTYLDCFSFDIQYLFFNHFIFEPMYMILILPLSSLYMVSNFKDKSWLFLNRFALFFTSVVGWFITF